MKPLTRKFAVLAMLIMLLSLASSGVATASDAPQTFETPTVVVNTSFLNVRTGPGVQYTVLVTVVGGTELPVLGVFEDGVWYQVNTDGGPGWINIQFTLPRGDFTNLPLLDVGDTGAPNVDLGQSLGQGGGFVAPVAPVATVNNRIQGVALIGRDLRAQPDSESLILSRSVPNDPTTIYPLINATTGTDGTTWYQVNLPGVGVGWTVGVILRVLGCSTETVAVTTIGTPITFDGIANREPFTLPEGTEGYLGAFRGVNNEFVEIELQDGTVGLVRFADTTPRTGVTEVCQGILQGPATTASLGQGGGATDASDTTQGTNTTIPVLASNTVVINTSFLNLRSGPSAGFSIVATVSGGEELVVLGRATDNVWFLVQGVFGQAWLNSQFTLFRGDYSTVPVITEPVLIGVPGTEALGQGGGFASPTGGINVVTGRSVTGVTLVGKDLHEGPSYESLIISRSVPNDPTTIYPLLATQVTEGTTWYLVDVPNIGRGWMDFVNFRLLECDADTVGVLTETTQIQFDGFANRDSFLLDFLTEVYIVGRRGELAIVQLQDGGVGLIGAETFENRAGVTSVCTGVTDTVSSVTPGVSASTTTQATTTTGVPVPQVSGNRVVINTGNLNVRSGPNATFASIATVAGGTELAVIGRATDGVWYFVEGTFGQGWVNSEFVLFRGDFGTVPVIDVNA
ncbi:MAG: SH3 domain-containing protein [Chloroflexota bacterium]